MFLFKSILVFLKTISMHKLIWLL